MLAALAFIYCYVGREKEAIKVIKRAMRLNPIIPYMYYWTLGMAYRMSERYEDAVKTCEKCINIAPNFFPPYVTIAISYVAIGDIIKANEAINSILKIDPEYNLEKASTIPYKSQSDMNRFIDALRKAGLPD